MTGYEHLERQAMRERATELAGKGLDSDVVYARLASMYGIDAMPTVDTVRRWMRGDRPRPKPRNVPKRVVRYDGRVFKSAAKAAESIGVSACAVRSAINRGMPCHGVRFRYVEE